MSEPRLRRILTLWPLIFYGMSVIVGAGIYVAIGSVMGRAGNAAPISFLLAGAAAACTGLCYAGLAGRFPEAAGAVSYVRHGFGSDRLALLTGVAITAAVAVAAASIARGAVQYVAVLAPFPAPVLITVLVAGFTAVAVAGVGASVGLAAALGALEVAGLLAAAVAGFVSAPVYHVDGMIPVDMGGWQGVVAGAFLAFFAFIGFENLANLAEEVKDARRTVPRGILGAVAASIALYVLVTTAAVLADAQGGNPLLALFSGRSATVFAVVGGISVANGVLVQIIMLARLFYGMARGGQLPSVIGTVHPRTQTPITATVLAGAIVLATALLVSFERLLVLTNAVTLAVFAVVDVALWRVQRLAPAHEASIPQWVPLTAAAFSVALLSIELLN